MRLSPTDLKALTVFRSVVDHRGFLGAQLALGLSQSAVSSHMKLLEDRLGYRLCRRGRAGFALTDRGSIVYERSKALFAAMSAFESELGELRAKVTGTLRIGIVDNTITDPGLPVRDVIDDFLRKSDGAQLQISVGEPEHLIAEVGNGGVDIALVPETNRHKGLNFTRFYEESTRSTAAASTRFFLPPIQAGRRSHGTASSSAPTPTCRSFSTSPPRRSAPMHPTWRRRRCSS